MSAQEIQPGALLTEREIALLQRAASSNILAYMPPHDLMIVRFVALGLVEDAGGVLSLTPAGHAAAEAGPS
ncbi:MAG: hypothetical protein JWL93_1951 [Hyphomicrobiales bacterium]|jgi:hypothetical protein|nr:hypothetical protein [Hyphomicrobiales bacterium]